MRVAENITVDARGLLIDGRRLPYLMAIKPVIVETPDPVHNPMSIVTIHLLADSVSIGTGVEVSPDGDVILIEESQ